MDRRPRRSGLCRRCPRRRGLHPLGPGKVPLPGPSARLSKKWLAPLFRGFHSSLAPTARPGSYAGKPLLRKAFCGFDAHVAKSDYSLRGPRPPSPQGFLDKLRSAPVKFLYRGRAHSIVAPVGRGRVGATVRLGVLLPFLALVEIVAPRGGGGGARSALKEGGPGRMPRAPLSVCRETRLCVRHTPGLGHVAAKGGEYRESQGSPGTATWPVF